MVRHLAVTFMKWLFSKPHPTAMPLWQFLLCLLPLVICTIGAAVFEQPLLVTIGGLATLACYYENKSHHLEK